MAINLGQIFYQLGVDTSGLNKGEKDVKNFTGKTQKSFNAVDSAARTLRNTLITVVSVETIRRSLKLADNYALLRDRVKAVVGTVKETNRVFSQLERIAEKTGTSLEGVAGGFQKLSFAKETVGGTNEDMIRLTKSFTELALISGTAPDQFNSAMLQFSQGLVTGTFQAQEFQSVIEAIPAALPEIAKGMDITVAQLIKLKKEGKLVSKDVFDALLKRSEAIAAQAEKLPTRMGRGFNRLTLGFQQLLADLDRTLDITERIGSSMFEMGEKLAKSAVVIRAFFMTLKQIIATNENLQDIVKAFVAMAAVILTVTVVVKALNIALAVLAALTAPITIIAALLTGIALLVEKTIGLGTAFELLKEIVTLVLKNMGTSIVVVKDALVSLADALKKTVTLDFKGAKQALNGLISDFDDADAILLQRNADFKKKIQEIWATSQDNKAGGIGTGVNEETLSFMEQFNVTMAQLNQEAKEKELGALADHNAQVMEFEAMLAQNRKGLAEHTMDFINNVYSEGYRQQQQDLKGNIEKAAKSSKEFFELNKALTLADLAVKTPQAIGDSYAYGTGLGGPILGGVFAGVAAAAMGVQIAAASSASFTPRAGGGDIFPNQIYKVNENGPEMFNFGGDDFLSTGSSRGFVDPTGGRSGSAPSGKSNVTVNVYPTEGQTARVEEVQTPEGTKLEVFLEMIDENISNGIRNGESKTSESIAGIFGLNRATGVAF